MKRNSLFIRKPSLMISVAIYLASFILLLSGVIFYDYAEDMLSAQREDILNRTVEYAVEYVNEQLESVRATAVTIRSNLRYVPMPVASKLTSHSRLALNEASAQLETIISAEDLLSDAYLYSNEAGYAIFPTSVLDDEHISRIYGVNGFTKTEMDMLHKTYSLGRLVSSADGKQLAYTLSVGKDADGAPMRQVVMLLKYNVLQNLIGAMDAPLSQAVYTIQDGEGEALCAAQVGQIGENTISYRYMLDSGYVMEVTIESGDLGEEVEHARRIYFAAVVLGLVVVTVITMITCRFSKVPINQLTDYLRKHYRSVTDTQGEGLEALRLVVDDILINHDDAQRQLEALKEDKRWHDLAAMFGQSVAKGAGWKGKNYALMLFAPEVNEREALLPVIRSVTDESKEWALMMLADGAALMLGDRVEEMKSESLCSFAEKLLSALDEQGFASLRVALSACHKELSDINIAYREAVMARDCLYKQVDVPVLHYEACDFQPGAFRTDAEYMQRQQHFNRLVSQGKFEDAKGYLRQLVPAVFMDEAMSRSETGKMHLEMVKYQMISCMDYIYKGTDEALDIRRDSIREMLMCTTYQQVLDIMERLLADQISQETEEVEKSGSDETLLKVKMYIRTHFSDPQLSITSIADVFDMTPNSLSKLFSRKAGVGVLQYIHKIRIENACNLILNSGLSLTEISKQVGYTNTLTFSRAFKARYHMSPSEWRCLNEDNSNS